MENMNEQGFYLKLYTCRDDPSHSYPRDEMGKQCPYNKNGICDVDNSKCVIYEYTMVNVPIIDK